MSREKQNILSYLKKKLKPDFIIASYFYDLWTALVCKNNDIKNVYCNVGVCLLLFTTKISYCSTVNRLQLHS